jgi:hypothetical protein
MNDIMIEEFDDNEIEVDLATDPDEVYIKSIIKKGIEDSQKLAETLNNLIDLAEPFGDIEALNELALFYNEVVPSILVGDYELLLDGVSKSQYEIALATFKLARKEMFTKLTDKYEN